MTSRRAGIRLLAVGITLAVLSIAIDALRDLDIYLMPSLVVGLITRIAVAPAGLYLLITHHPFPPYIR